MKKTVKTAAVFLAALTAAGMVSCSPKTGKDDITSGPESDKNTIVSTGTTTKAPDVSFDGVSAESRLVSNDYKDGDVQLIINLINCPVFSGSAEYNFEKINSALSEYCDNYAKITESARTLAKEDYSFLGDGFECHSKSADYTYYVKDGILSVKYEATETSGGAGDLLKTTALCFDLHTGEHIDLAAYLGKDTDYAKQYMASAFSMLIKISPDDYFDSAEEFLPGLIDGYGFYLNETGLVLFLNSGTIAPEVRGVQTVTVAYANLPL